MIEYLIINHLYILILVLSIIQSVFGIGLLILGTPILLILKYNMLDTMCILLPCSIINSFSNFLIFNLKKKISIEEYKKKIYKNFFLYCISFTIIGLLLLKIAQDLFNFKILVSTIIISSLILKIYYEKKLIISANLHKVILSGIGIIHGLTNSGGILMSLFLMIINKNAKNLVRQQTIFFYFILAIIQLTSILLLFTIDYKYNFFLLFFSNIAGIIIGIKILKYVSKKIFLNTISLLAFISSVYLLFAS